MAKKDASDPQSAAILFPDAHHQSFHGADFRTAGNDIYMPTFNVNFHAQGVSVTPSPSSPLIQSPTSRTSTKGKKRLSLSRAVQQVSRLFQPSGQHPQPPRSPLTTGFEEMRRAVEDVPSRQTLPQLSVSASTLAPTQDTATASCPSKRSSEDYKVFSLDDLDVISTQFQDISKAEIYIRSMLPSRKGLPCWHPRPRGPFVGKKGVVPGDVGTFRAADGFNKIFNLWEDEQIQKLLSRAPPKSVMVYEGELAEGDTIVDGTTSRIYRTPCGRSVTQFEFTCQAQQGAILACTSSADLEELVDIASLQDLIIQNAGLIYRHANGVRGVSDEDSLYIISGCIKSDSWGVAAYADAMPAPHDVLRLVKFGDVYDPASPVTSYTWTDRGMAETRFGSSLTARLPGSHNGKEKDQSLFLRGFKLALSRNFRSRLKDPSFKLSDGSGSKDTGSDSNFPPEPSSKKTDTHDGKGGGGPTGSSQFGPAGGSSSNSSSSGYSHALAGDIKVESFPPFFDRTVHPCDKITEYLLKTTGADFALSHDDDWRFSPKFVLWDGPQWDKFLQSHPITTCNGVAYLTPRDLVPSASPTGSITKREAFESIPASSRNVSSPFPKPGFQITSEGVRSRGFTSSSTTFDPNPWRCSSRPNDPPEWPILPPEEELREKEVSDRINRKLEAERLQKRKQGRPVKVLLLGQSESGKTTTLKNFRLSYSKREWEADRAAWRPVIFLNFIRNVISVVEHLHAEMSDLPMVDDGEDLDDDISFQDRSLPPLEFTEEHYQLVSRLKPLADIQRLLELQLGIQDQNPKMKISPLRIHNPCFHSLDGQNVALEDSKPCGEGCVQEKENDFALSLELVKDDIRKLWGDPIVKEALTRRRCCLEDTPGLFITDAERIASRFYQPTDDDVLRARLQTVGVQEHKFTLPSHSGTTFGREWCLYDVGGARSSRAAWVPFFDDVDALIFLAPVSAFDERLSEDRRVNRLEDSYDLWKTICSSKLLARAILILFLNKCDLLQAKLRRGIQIRDSIPSFGDRSNDAATAIKFFRQHFKDIAREYSPVARPFHACPTSVTDIKATAVTLQSVKDSISREHLRAAHLL